MKTSIPNPVATVISLALILLAATISILAFNTAILNLAAKSTSRAVLTIPSWDLVKPVILFGLMLLGMFFNQLFELLQAQKKEGHTVTNIASVVIQGIRGITFWMAVVVSPIVFFGSFYLVDTSPDNKAVYFYAFQNGFFWYYIFNKAELKAKSGVKK